MARRRWLADELGRCGTHAFAFEQAVEFGVHLRQPHLQRFLQVVEAAELLDAGKVSVNKAYRMVRSAVQALDGGDGSEEEKAEAAEQTAGEFNLACKESVARYMKEICAILEKVEKLSDEDFNMMPWRALDAAQKRLTRMLAELDERVKRKRVKLFENMKGAVADGTHQ